MSTAADLWQLRNRTQAALRAYAAVQAQLRALPGEDLRRLDRSMYELGEIAWNEDPPPRVRVVTHDGQGYD